MLSGKKGYKISLDKARNILKVQAWGVWGAEDTELAKNFKRELKEKVTEISINGKGWDVCGDLTKLSPQSREIRRIVSEGIRFAIRHGMKKVVHLVS